MEQIKINIHEAGIDKMGMITLPSCWNEVPAAAYPYLAEIYLSIDLSDSQKMTQAFYLLVNAEKKNKSKIENLLLPEEIYDLLLRLDWVFNKVDLTKNLVPGFVLHRKLYIGPDNGLKNVRFAEWIVADTNYVNYCHSRDEGDINQLVACLYRPKGKGDCFKPNKACYRGDEREKFNDAVLEIRAGTVANLPINIRLGIYLWFASCRQQIIASYPKVFEPDENTKNANSLLAGDGWLGVYDDLRGDPKFGGPDKLEEEFIHTIFQSLTRTKIKNDELRREYGL